ncbi:oxidoreductase [Bifidobacterium hapali]|uniref:Oxidoreductase n=2 Tax=Bifidobacterium hapali TaxID=1630172 RepID=A0A261G1S1_9BIFI|nr:oxidoreductase [Bifidobacterium hapali]
MHVTGSHDDMRMTALQQTSLNTSTTRGANRPNIVAFAGRHNMPRIGMGTMALAIEGRPDRETAIGTIHAALDAGVRYLDTAWSYYLPTAPGADGTGVPADFGYGERLVHDALANWDGPRDEVLVATKTGYRRTISANAGADVASDRQRASDHADADQMTQPAPARQRLQAVGSQYGWMADSRPETMIRDAKESAQRLGFDELDLLYSHGPDPAVPYEDQIGALKTLLDEGVIRYAGISRVSNAQIDIACSMLGNKLIAVQNQFSPSHPDPEQTMAHCAQLGLDFVCWSPLGGFLDPFDQRAYDPFRTVAAARGVSYQRVVLAWELTRYDRLFTIPSARNPHEINDSFAALDLHLTPEELAVLG